MLSNNTPINRLMWLVFKVNKIFTIEFSTARNSMMNNIHFKLMQ